VSSTLTQADLRLTYLRDPFAIESIDQDQVIEELSTGVEEDPASRRLGRRLFTDFHHLVLASDRYGRSLAVLGARDGSTPREDFLLLETGFVKPSLRGRGLMHRMIMLILLRASADGPVPKIIASRTCDGPWFRMLRSLASRLDGCSFFPQLDEPAVNLATTGLAQRIARQLGRGLQLQISSGALRRGCPVFAEAGTTLMPLARDPLIDSLFAQNVALSDDILSVLDLRAGTEEEVIERARTVYRKR
jgi:hypothetical protein